MFCIGEEVNQWCRVKPDTASGADRAVFLAGLGHTDTTSFASAAPSTVHRCPVFSYFFTVHDVVTAWRTKSRINCDLRTPRCSQSIPICVSCDSVTLIPIIFADASLADGSTVLLLAITRRP